MITSAARAALPLQGKSKEGAAPNNNSELKRKFAKLAAPGGGLECLESELLL
jgi:hypothetical protein